ncbi:MAG: hypothetical protein H6839_08410 [Planctomycetes bacterium]|nr:hypothetical protein [Planctomycetota bacterium]
MLRCLLILTLLAAPLAAEYESNFGRVILANCDVILQGVASATRAKVGTSSKVQVTVETVLYGKEAKTEIVVFYADPDVLKKDEAVRGMFALKRLADGGYNLVGRPVLTPDADPEESDKLRVARKFIALEDQPAGDERTEDFWNLLLDGIDLGGYAAQNAAVELMYVAKDRGGIITEERFEEVLKARETADKRFTKQTREDLKLACQGLVEAQVKSLKFRRVRRSETPKDKRSAADELMDLQKDYTRAFTEEDAKLCDALVDISEDDVLTEKLKKLARAIRSEIKIREAEERNKNAGK